MKVVLDIATFLGGLAALWFFFDKFSSYKKRRKFIAAKPEATSDGFQLILNEDQILAIVSCIFCGAVLAFVGVKYGFIWLGGVGMLGAVILGFIGGRLDNWGFVRTGETFFLGTALICAWAMFEGAVGGVIQERTYILPADSLLPVTLIIIGMSLATVSGVIMMYTLLRA